MRAECRAPVAIRRLGWLVVAPAAMVLASCGGMMPEMAAPEMMATAAPIEPAVLPAIPPEATMMPPMPTPTPGIAARERFQVAISALQQGDSTRAAVELHAYLAEVPNSVPARNLLAQIEAPLDMLYPT